MGREVIVRWTKKEKKEKKSKEKTIKTVVGNGIEFRAILCLVC